MLAFFAEIDFTYTHIPTNHGKNFALYLSIAIAGNIILKLVESQGFDGKCLLNLSLIVIEMLLKLSTNNQLFDECDLQPDHSLHFV